MNAYALAAQLPCYCCTCPERYGSTEWDPACNLHGAHGAAACDFHGKPGSNCDCGCGHKALQWGVLDNNVLEEWPTEDTAREQMRHFYSLEARLVRWTSADGWVDVDGQS